MDLLKLVDDVIWFFSLGLLISTVLYEFYVTFSPVHACVGIAFVIIVTLLIIYYVYPGLEQSALL